MCANSLAAANQLKKICEYSARLINSCNQGILVGGFINNQVHLEKEVIELIKATCDHHNEATEISEIAFSYRSMLKPQHGADRGEGLLYRKGESVILDTDDIRFVVVIVQFLCIEISGQFQEFVDGKLMSERLDGDGQGL